MSQRLVAVNDKPNDDLPYLAGLMEDGTMTPVIDRSCSLSEAPDAVGYVEQGHAQGKIVITM